MRPPGLHRPHVEQPHKSPKPAGQDRRVIVQCERCGMTSSGRTLHGRLRWSEAPHYATPGAKHLRHIDCGGRLVGFDIAANRQ